MYINLILYFIVGVILDILLTLNWRYVAKDQAVPATIFSFLVTIASMAVFYTITRELDPQKGMTNIIAYAIGVGVGTYVGMKLPLIKKLKK